MREVYPSEKPRPKTTSRVIEWFNRIDVASLAEPISLVVSAFTSEIPRHDPIETAGEQAEVRQLHMCSDCGSNLVNSIDESFDDSGSDQPWDIILECPNCFKLEADTCSDAEMDALNDEHIEGIRSIKRDISKLAYPILKDLDILQQGLQHDIIGPDDFRA
jgi:hypothetical protein